MIGADRNSVEDDGKDNRRTIIPATPGWELISVRFVRGIKSDPVVFREPVIAWDLSGGFTRPILPQGTLEPPDMETEYNTYRCPDGTVLGGIHEGQFKDLRDFVEACVVAEQDYLEANGRLGDQHPDERPSGTRWDQRQDGTWGVSRTHGLQSKRMHLASDEDE